MKKEDEFYIGYLEKAPTGLSKFLKSRVLFIGLVVILAALGFAIAQSPFSNSSFELGKLTKVEGTFYNDPYPMLKVQSKGGQFKNVLLLGFGKFGADNGLKEIESLTQQSLIGKRISVEGTLIYYNGQTLMQLENDIEGTIQGLGGAPAPVRVKELVVENWSLKGEIIDPKCYFGVMKPGLGKIHRSCAARCISGGIPPVFVTRDSSGHSNYFLIADENGERLKDELVPYIGKGVQIEASIYQMEDWKFIQLNPKRDIEEIEKYSDIYLLN